MIKISDIINLHQLYELSIEGGTIPVSVLKFSAQEELSQPFQFTIEFTSLVKDIDRADILNKSASFNLYEPIDPFVIATKLLLSQAEPSSEMPGAAREVPGIITDFALLSRSLDESRYRIILQPHIALLGNTHRTAIYQNISVPEVIEKILRAHQFNGTHFHLDLTQTYPSREFIMQYQESDLTFIQRIAAEVGIWFRFDIDTKIKREVVYFSDAIAKYQFGTTLPLIHPGGLAATDSEAVWDITAVHKVVEKKVTTKDYHYDDADNPLKVDATLSEPVKKVVIYILFLNTKQCFFFHLL